MRFFCFGFGYVARHLAAHADAVAGTVRTAATRPGAYVMGADGVLDKDGLAALEAASHVLVSIPPDEEGADAAWRYHARALRGKAWIGYLSTTGVYGDHRGAWVDEDSPLLATESRSLRRIEAERHWRECGAHIFRLAGIYGEGRNALDKVRDGTARRIHKEGQHFSRIHVADIVQALLASAAAPRPGETYNLADDEPAPAHEVVAHACRLLGQELPPLIPFEAAGLSGVARSFYSGNRRISNCKIKNELGISLCYPTYREGLASILHSMQGV